MKDMIERKKYKKRDGVCVLILSKRDRAIGFELEQKR